MLEDEGDIMTKIGNAYVEIYMHDEEVDLNVEECKHMLAIITNKLTNT